MTETTPRYRTLARPGPGLATIAEPDGRVSLWSRTTHGYHVRTCARCGASAGLYYRPSLYRGPHDTPRLCRPCVEGTPDPAPGSMKGPLVPDGYVTPREAAAMLGLAPSTVYSQRAAGVLRAIRGSSDRYLIALAEVERYRTAPKRGGGRRGAAPGARVGAAGRGVAGAQPPGRL